MSDSSEDPRELARRLAAQAKARAQGGSRPPSAPKKPLTPQEALRLAIEAEQKAKAAPKPPSKPAPKPAAQAAPTPAPKPVAQPSEPSTDVSPAPARHVPAAEPAPAPQPAAPAPKAAAPAAAAPDTYEAAALLTSRVAGASVAELLAIAQPMVFTALWKAHRARATKEADLTVLATADVLIDANRRLPAGALKAARIELDGTAYAAFVDTSHGVILGILPQPDIWLAGL